MNSPRHSLEWWQLLAMATLTLLMNGGCKKSPTDPAPTQATIEGTYVGRGDFGGGLANVLVQFIGPDSLSQYSGAIRYEGTITNFEDILVNDTRDTVWFGYHRLGTWYHASAPIEAVGLALDFSEPIDMESFLVNREQGGYNMSGYWTGLFETSYSQNPVTAEMVMDQQGQIFTGTVTLQMSGNPTLDVRSGASNNGSFDLSGTGRVYSLETTSYLYGTYFAPDTLQGMWQVGDNPAYDSGEFLLIRSFD